MTIKKIKSSDILGDNYYIYNLTSSNYTPNLNGSITITCTVKNIYGDTIANKSIQLYQNDTAVGSATTTNNNGVATWTVTCSTAGIQKFSIKDTVIEVFVDTTSKTGHNHTTSDITNFPEIPTKTSDLTNDSNFLTSHQSLTNYIQKSNTNGLIKNDGTIDTNTYLTTHQDISDKVNTSDLGETAFSNDYNDLDNLPTIPAAYTHPLTHPATMITGLSTVATSGSYNDLSDKPTIPIIPTNVSAFTNDSGYLTSHQDISNKEDVSNKSSNIITDTGSTTKYPSVKAVEDYAVQKIPMGDVYGAGVNSNSLQKQIQSASSGNIIVLDKDYLNNSNATHISVSSKNIAIIGNGHIIDGNNKLITFNASGTTTLKISNCVFQNLTLTTAQTLFRATDSAKIIIDNCIFKNIKIKQFSGIINTDQELGNASYTSAEIKILNSSFLSITGYTFLKFCDTNFSIINTIFENNAIDSILVNNTSSTNFTQEIINCVFNNNYPAITDSSTGVKSLVLKNNHFLQSGDTITGCTNNNYLTQHQDISGKVNTVDLSDVATSGSYNDLTDKPTIPSVYTHPTTHPSSMITDSNTHSNIGNTANTLENIITNIDTKLGSLANVDLVEVTSSLGTASANTMNKLYLVAETTGATNDNYEVFVTVRTGTSGNYSYSWEKVDTARIDLSDYLTTANAQQTYVAKENGKGLSSNDYTTAEKNKLAGLHTVATSGNYNDLSNKPTIPTVPINVSAFTNDSGYLTSHQDISGKANTSDLGSLAYEDDIDLSTHDVSELTDTNDTAFTPKSHNHGNLLNTGQVGLVDNRNMNVVTNAQGMITVEDKPTIPSASSATPSADTTNGSYGSGTDYARSNHTHPKSSLYAESSHTHGNIKNDGTFNAVHVVDTYNMNVVTNNQGVISLEDKYTHPNDLGSTKTSGLYKIALNDKGHVTSATSVEKSDITGLGIPASDTTYSLADGTTNGLSSNDFTSAEKTKLSGIATGANNYTHPASHGNITSDGKCSTTGTVDVSRGDLLLFADATSGANQYTIKGSTFVDALNDLILDLIDEGES